MITKNSLAMLSTKTETTIEYDLTERWLEKEIEPQMIARAKEEQSEYEFVVHVSEANPSMIRKVLNDKGYSVLMWAEPVDAKPPIMRFRFKILW